MSTQTGEKREITKWQWFLLWAGFFLLLALAFGAGYLMGRGANPAPIVIEKCSGG